MNRNLVAIGTSSGGIEALQSIVAALPGDFPAALCIVLHTAPDTPGILADILARAGPLPVCVVRGREQLRPGRIYLPAPDHHLIVEPGVLRASRGPRENRFRPAIDPLLRSAAQVYGPRVIGVILTGGMDDGVAGLWAIKRLGGVTLVQDPKDAAVDVMPRHAIEHVDPDYCLPLADIPALLRRLVAENIVEASGYLVPEQMRIEVKMANEDPRSRPGVETLGQPSRYSCPECHGVLFEIKEGARSRFRCHTGHAYSLVTLLEEYDKAIETSLWNAVRVMQEQALLLQQVAGHVRDRHHDPAHAGQLVRRAESVQRRSDQVRHVMLEAIDENDAARKEEQDALPPTGAPEN